MPLLCMKMKDTAEKVLKCGRELEDNYQYRFHNNTRNKWEEIVYIFRANGEKWERKKKTNREVKQTETGSTGQIQKKKQKVHEKIKGKQKEQKIQRRLLY